VVYDTVIHREPQMGPSSSSLDSCCCTRTQPRVDSYPSFLDVPKHKLLASLQGFG
jgi:hypothetical protein